MRSAEECSEDRAARHAERDIFTPVRLQLAGISCLLCCIRHEMNDGRRVIGSAESADRVRSVIAAAVLSFQQHKPPTKLYDRTGDEITLGEVERMSSGCRADVERIAIRFSQSYTEVRNLEQASRNRLKRK